ncbi:hypothetical protein [Glycomyces dulcitolivorans]|uniref:hypothetical protein n=1 Tax=Glycomyces dulcitolivorans TaxID=2200759 RepID=UPI000DD41CF5|nr:hypothetical protein [Glycomyces dulcitolivorans]
MEKLRIKPEHAPFLTRDGNVRIGGGVYGIAAEIEDPQGWKRPAPKDRRRLIADYLAGALQKDLATWYSIGLSSVKTVLREAGAEKYSARIQPLDQIAAAWTGYADFPPSDPAERERCLQRRRGAVVAAAGRLFPAVRRS